MRRLLVFPVFLALAIVLGYTSKGMAAVAPPWDPFFASQSTVGDFGAATRPFGIAAGDFDGDTKVDLVVGRTTGNVAFIKGNGDGTFATPIVFAWKQAFFNGWAFAAGDINRDGKLDVIWGANVNSPGTAPFVVNDGEVRVFFGNGDGTFVQNSYFVTGVLHNAGTLLADIGTDAGSLTAGDVDGDGGTDVVAGAVDGTNSVVKLLRNDGTGVTVSTVLTEPTACTTSGTATTCNQIYFPAISTQNSPWGLALGDIDGDSDLDLWIGDRALYVYRFLNDGTGVFSLSPPSSPPLPTRANVYLAHDSFRAAVGFTPSLGSADINGDSNADVVLGLHSGTQTPASNTANDGVLLLDVSNGSGHTGFGSLADIGTMARGVTVLDINGDTYRDIVASEFDGKVKLLRQLPPVDSDGDGVSDYVDNAPNDPNAARLDMNTDLSINHRDQLDNDFDTVLGDPEDPATWQRLGDPADPDDDNDGVADVDDICPLVADLGQSDVDGDAAGDACDPLDNRDDDGDGVPNGPVPGDALYDMALAAKSKWSQGKTHFVIRIDALGRFFQNEFTQIMTDAATLSPEDWPAKCWENYGPGGGDPEDPCGTGEGTADQTLTLPGGKEVPITLVTIPKQLWTDPPVIEWINDRNENALFELGQHGSYHANNVPNSDWASMPDRNFFSCELCGLTEAENFELMKVGYDTLLGNYANKWVAESTAAAGSPNIDWSTSAYPLLSFAPPFNTSDPSGREALARLGFKAFSASRFEEGGFPGFSEIFTPEGSHHEQFDQFAMFHASADLELEPPDTTGDTYDSAEYEAYLQTNTDEGGLTTWLIEEVEWSGRPCQNDDRLGTCNGGSNRENNTVYLPRWEAWMQLLDFVKDYPGGVAMTMGEVALARAFDNAPTAFNPDQTDSDHDGIGDVIDGATLAAADGSLSRNVAGSLSATLTNGAGNPIVDQTVIFTFDSDGDGTDEVHVGTTGLDGVASVTVTATRSVGPASFQAAWDGGRGVTASDLGEVLIVDASFLSLDDGNPSSGQVTDSVTVAATLTDSDGAAIEGRTVTFSIGAAAASGTTDALGHAEATLVLQAPAGLTDLVADFAGDDLYGPSSDSAPFDVLKEDTVLTLPDAVATRTTPAVAMATLKEADGVPLAGKNVAFYIARDPTAGSPLVSIGGAITDGSGVAKLTVPQRYLSVRPRELKAVFITDDAFLGSEGNAGAYRTR